MRDKGIEREWTMMAGDSGGIEGFSHIPSILRKEDPEKTEDPALTDVVNQGLYPSIKRLSRLILECGFNFLPRTP